MTTLKFSTTKDEFNVELVGTQNNPIIWVEKYTFVDGTCIQGKASIQHWKSRNLKPGLYFRDSNTYVVCPERVEVLKKEISKLPVEKKYARKELEKITSDGSIIIEKWNFEATMWTKEGEFISDDEMSEFLDKQGINEIELNEAIKLYENRPLKKREKYNAQFQFETDVIEEGYTQACENAGILEYLR